MYDSDNKKTNAQRLAETLKRCGLASSVSQAHQMAGEITSTEQKVQVFFDRKKQEMKDDLMKTVHPNREEFKSARSNDVVSAQIENFRADNARGMVNLAKNPEPLNIQVEFETPYSKPVIEPPREEIITSPAIEIVQEQLPSSIEIPKIEEEAPKIEVFHDELPKIETVSPKIEIIHDEISENKTISETRISSIENKEEIREKEDFINRFIESKEEKEIPTEEIKPLPAVEKEEIKPEEVAQPKPYTLPPQRPTQSQVMGPHPKTGNSSGIDINSFFNFQKKGKV